MPFAREFLDWNQPCLPQAAAWLLNRWPDGDLSAVLIALPGARAGRRLLQLLVELAAQRRVPLIPPRITTPGHLADELLHLKGEAALSDAARQQAWAAALQQTDEASLTEILVHIPDPGDTAAWQSLALQLESLHRELIAQNLHFIDVAERGEQLPDFTDGSRWRSLAAVQQRYLAILKSAGLTDPDEQRWHAISESQFREDRTVILIAAVELNALQRAILTPLAERTTVLIHADAADSADFDDLGTIVTDHWRQRDPGLDDRRVRIADGPADQAAAAVRTIASFNAAYAADQITVGVCDDQVAPFLDQQLPTAGLPVRSAAGTELPRTAPVRLLAAAADFLDAGRFSDLATLLRHPDLESHITTAAAACASASPGKSIEDWLTLLDRYYTDHLHGRITGDWLGDAATQQRLKQVHDGVLALMGDLAGEPRRLAAWAQPILDLILRVYGASPLLRHDPHQRLIIDAADHLHAIIAELHTLPVALSPKVSAADALRVVMQQARQAPPIPPRGASAGVIELLGSLELHLDDAPALIITGVNEGRLPASVTADAFLPDSLRRHLGLTDNARRYARDAYALAAICRSRPSVTLISGRRSAEGDPLAPSRLLLAGPHAQLPARVQRFFRKLPVTTQMIPPRWGFTGESRIIVPPKAIAPLEPITQLSVTAFRDYIACPYRFYLKHILHLERLDDQGEELDGGAFGSLAHDVLRTFGASDAAKSTDPARIRRTLSDALDDQVRRSFGSEPPPPVRVQVEQLRSRFDALAEKQSKHAAEGWRIAHTEISFRKTPALLDVDGVMFNLTGRIDRIDQHETTGDIAVFDYKTGDQADPPDKTHRKQGEWIDLQLPLYRRLARVLNATAPVKLGFILLPRSPGDVGFQIADWTDADLAAAEDVAMQIVRDIRDGKFEPTADPPQFDDFGDICGVQQLASLEEETQP